MLQEFASDTAALCALQNVALPPHGRKMAASVKHDSEFIICLATPTAVPIAEAFFMFLQEGGLVARVAAMLSGQILSLCLFYSRLF